MTKQVTPAEAKRILWERGEIAFKLHEGQKKIYTLFKETPRRTFPILSSRQLGKTYSCFVIASETAIKNPGCTIKYIAPTKQMAKRIAKKTMGKIFKDCPSDLKYEWKEKDMEFVFPNGSIIEVHGTDNGNHENIRGDNCLLAILDEAGFCSELGYVVRSILVPLTTRTNGKILLVSTVSKNPNHEFMTEYVKRAKAEGALLVLTIYDNPDLTPADIESIINEYPGRENDPGFRRECLCEIDRESEDSVIPEITEELLSKIVTDNYKKPAYCDFYTSGDLGFRDLTIYLFGFFDFEQQRLIIEDELVLFGTEVSTKNIAVNVMEKEQLYFKQDTQFIPPFRRVMDNDLIIINELQKDYNINFLPTDKDNKESYIDKVRYMLAREKIIVNPRCVHLLYHLKNGVWKSKASKNGERNMKATFCRLPDIKLKNGILVRGGHCDGIDALIYMVRILNINKNPYPIGFGQPSGSDSFFSKNKQEQDPMYKTLMRILNFKKKN